MFVPSNILGGFTLANKAVAEPSGAPDGFVLDYFKIFRGQVFQPHPGEKFYSIDKQRHLLKNLFWLYFIP